jgi:hypothetical protein
MSQIAATIVGQTFHHEGPLSLDQVFNFYDTVCLEMNKKGEFPTYLFLTAKDEAILSGLLQMASAYPRESNAPMRNFLLMHVVILPTLPENTLIIGKLVLHEDPFQVIYDLQNTTSPEGLD